MMINSSSYIEAHESRSSFKQDKTYIYYITPFDNNTEYFINHHDNKFFILKSINVNITIYSVNYKFTTNNNEKTIERINIKHLLHNLNKDLFTISLLQKILRLY